MSVDNFYFKIAIAYEVQQDILDSEEPSIVKAKEILYKNLKELITEKYDKFYIKLSTFQQKNSLNYIIELDSFFTTESTLPMSEYSEAKDISDNMKQEMNEFFNSIDCDYKQINILKIL